jgi:CRISPR-associated protein (TIGR03986 family)
MITAPFNFVPLNQEVFFPPWAEDVSHDIPFSDGESGEIEITITAKSPIFIRDHKNPEEFCHYIDKDGNKHYYIPGSSVKGIVRNVLEIMSFSKMSFVDDKTYSIRDLDYKKYMEMSKNVKCGWLYLEDGKLKLEDCGEPYRVSYDEFDRYFNINFKQNFMDGTFNNANSPYKKAFRKYELLSNLTNQDIKNSTFNFSKDGNKNGRETVRFDKNGNIRGKLVLTGHPSARKEPEKGTPSGKIYDFVFKETENPTIYNIDDKVFENFKFAYFDGRRTQPKESPDWKYWKSKLYNNQKIPVFFYTNMIGKVTSFGLSYLYKFPYTHSIMDIIFKNHTSSKLDLAQTIFGYIDGNKKALKGRVQFSHFKAIENIRELNKRTEILGTPRASYYPIYLVQNGDGYKTLMDSNAKLAGWKRYPIHRGNSVTQTEDTGNNNVGTTFKPLQDGVVFRGKIRFHNLKKVEIGALLSALTFHNSPNTYHNIGMAKPLGYGKIELKITNLRNLKHLQEEYLKAFESCMNSEIFDKDIKWHKSEQIVNLLTMTTEQDDSNLVYMQLKDFANEKKAKNYLYRYVNLNGVTTKETNSIIEIDDIESYLTNVKIFKEREKSKKIVQELSKPSKEVNIQIVENFITKYPEYKMTQEFKNKLQEIRDNLAQDKYREVNKKFDNAYNALQKKKSNQKQYKKELDKFIKKWSADKNNKGSEHIKERLKDIK